MKDLIDVSCIAFPTGETIWILSNVKYLRECISAWRNEHPEFEETKATIGITHIFMPKCYFEAIPTSNRFRWP